MNVSDGGVLTKASETTDLEILADGHDLLGHGLGNGQLGAGILAVHQGVHVSGIVLGNSLGDILDESHEQVGLGAEVGLAVHFHQSAHAVLGQRIGHTLGSNAASLLGSLGQALLAQPLNSLVHIAVALDQRLFAVHHTHAGHLAQGLYISSSKSHDYILRYIIV